MSSGKLWIIRQTIIEIDGKQTIIERHRTQVRPTSLVSEICDARNKRLSDALCVHIPS